MTSVLETKRIADLEKLVHTLINRIEKLESELHDPVRIDGGYDYEIYRPVKLYGTIGERTDHDEIPATAGSYAVAKGTKTITLTCDMRPPESRTGLLGTPISLIAPLNSLQRKKDEILNNHKSNLVNSFNRSAYSGGNGFVLCTGVSSQEKNIIDTIAKVSQDTSPYFVTATPFKQ